MKRTTFTDFIIKNCHWLSIFGYIQIWNSRLSQALFDLQCCHTTSSINDCISKNSDVFSNVEITTTSKPDGSISTVYKIPMFKF